MDESRYLKLHGYRFGFGFVQAFTYIFVITSIQPSTDSGRSWMLVNVILLISGVVIPWMISAFYMRRYRLYEQDYLPKTFLPAPLAGLLATLILPQIYLIYQIMTTSDMLISSNGFLILLTLIFFGSNVIVCSLQIR